MEHMSDSPDSIKESGSGSFKHDEGGDVLLHTDARLIHVIICVYCCNRLFFRTNCSYCTAVGRSSVQPFEW